MQAEQAFVVTLGKIAGKPSPVSGTFGTAMLDARPQLNAQFPNPSRRAGDRRKHNVAVERDNRTADRRENSPGLRGLIDDIFAR